MSPQRHNLIPHKIVAEARCPTYLPQERMKFGELSSMYGNVCSRPKYTRLVKRPTPTISTGKPSKMYRPARTAVENWTHSHKTRVSWSQRFTAEYSQNMKDGDIHSPLSCILLFGWWLLCILLLVLPSSRGRRLRGETKRG